MNNKQYKKFVQLLRNSATISRQKQIKNKENKILSSYFEGRNLAYLDCVAMLQELLEDDELKKE